MECYTRYTLAYSLQPRNQLEDKRDKDDKVSRRMWKAVKAKAEKVRMAETEEERKKKKREISEKKNRRRKQREVV